MVRRAIEANTVAAKKPKLDQIPAANLDQDDPIDDDDSSSSEDESDDDTAALLEELNKIKRERAQEAAQKEIEKKLDDEKIRMETILKGNPLLNYSSGNKPGQSTENLKVKRRWDDDVVFKNCARTEPDKKGALFINDSLRSEFHKKFMEKYIKWMWRTMCIFLRWKLIKREFIRFLENKDRTPIAIEVNGTTFHFLAASNAMPMCDTLTFRHFGSTLHK